MKVLQVFSLRESELMGGKEIEDTKQIGKILEIYHEKQYPLLNFNQV